MNSLHQEMCQLKTQIQDMRAALQQEESVCTQLRNQTSVTTAGVLTTWTT